MRKIFIFILGISVWACNSSTDECAQAPNVADIPVTIEVERLDQQLVEAKSRDEVKAFLDKHPDFARNVLQIDEYPDDSLLVNSLHTLVNDPYIDSLYQFVQQTFGDFEKWEKEFEQAFRYGKYYYPAMQVPEVKTMFTGLSLDMYQSPKTLIVGLDYFAGDDAPYRPMVPEYVLSRFTPEHIVPSSILLFSNGYNETNLTDNKMLAEMIYYGKAYYFTKKLLPCTADSLIIGYSPQQMAEVKSNQENIWAHFVDNQLLYSTSQFNVSKYMSERPAVVEIGNKCPGRIGRWLGWEIVKQYMDRNPEISLEQLMKETDVQKIFEGSKYRPR